MKVQRADPSLRREAQGIFGLQGHAHFEGSTVRHTRHTDDRFLVGCIGNVGWRPLLLGWRLFLFGESSF